jgi:YYY domain-containing protein
LLTMLDFLRWYLILTIFALAALPLGWTWFRHLPDRGWGLLRPLGLLLGGFFIWLLGSLQMLNLNAGSGFGAVVVLLAVGLVVLHRWGGRQDAGRGTQDAGTATHPLTPSQEGGHNDLGDGTFSPSSEGVGGWVALKEWLSANRWLIVTQELLFLGAFFFWTWYRVHDQLGIGHTEQPMDFALMNAIRRGGEMPPNDPWLSGFAISYYYLGYLIQAMVGAMSGVARGVDYNLAFASLPALASGAMFSVVYNLVPLADMRRRIAVGFLGVLLLVGVSNFAGVLTMTYYSGIGGDDVYRFFAVHDINPDNPQAAQRNGFNGWWWWAASRTVSDINPDGGRVEVIDEFPFFSYLLGDMHPHVHALPFALLGIGIAMNALFGAMAYKGETLRWRGLLMPPDAWGMGQGFGWLSFILTAIVIGSMSMLNTWDFPTQAALTALVWLFAVVIHAVRREGYTALGAWLGGVGLLSALALALYIPFYVGFDSQADGIRVVPWTTKPQQLFLMFGLFWVVLIPLLLLQLGKVGAVLRSISTRMAGFLVAMVVADALYLFALSRITLEEGRLALLVAAAWVLIPLAILGLLRDEEPTPLAIVQFGLVPLMAGIALQKWSLVLLAALLTLTLVALWAQVRGLLFPVRVADAEPRRARSTRPAIAGGSRDGDVGVLTTTILRADTTLIFALTLTALAFLLTMGTEIFYIKDGFGGRMNTVFKLYYQAWMLLAIAATFGAVYLSQHLPKIGAVVWGTLFAVCVGLSVWYPYQALPSKANYAADARWDGRAWMANNDPDRFAAINFFDALPGQVVILEKSGGAYNPSESAFGGFTGHSNVLGWKNHEGQWRGDYDEIGLRDPLIQTIYQTTNPDEARRLIEELEIDYVAVTPQEIAAYSLTAEQIEKFQSFMTPVFQQGNVIIFGR